ncbi:MAG: biotin/lipoyl-binding protein [Planctomycetota bacterium]|nr:biotin/lipoyl-binding protein [Planctomycetota bacterium]
MTDKPEAAPHGETPNPANEPPSTKTEVTPENPAPKTEESQENTSNPEHPVPENPAPSFLKKLLILPPLFLAAIIAGVMISKKEGSPRAPAKERAFAVRSLTIRPMTVVPRASGQGVVRPVKSWSVVAKVAGTILSIHESFRQGALVPEGTVLVEIDKRDYKLALAQTTAKINEASARLTEITTTEKSLAASIKIEKAALRLAQKKYDNNSKLNKKNIVSESVMDASERELLQQQANLQRLQNTVAELPTKRLVINAQINSLEGTLALQKLDIERSTIRAPFPLRIRSVNVEKEQFVSRGQVLGDCDGTDAAEVPANLTLDQVRPLVHQLRFKEILAAKGDSLKLAKAFNLSAEIKLRDGRMTSKWKARFKGTLGATDPRVRTLGFLVVVDKPYSKVIPAKRPPLFRGLFVDVEFRGPKMNNCIVIPRSALHGDQVYLIDEKQRLKKRAVIINFRQQDFVVLSEGLKAGERIIVSDPIPAIEGMLIDAKEDEKALERLEQQTRGEGDLR